MLKAVSVKNYCIIEFPSTSTQYTLDRKPLFTGKAEPWQPYTQDGFSYLYGSLTAQVITGTFLDNAVPQGVWQYRAQEKGITNKWYYSSPVRIGEGKPVGYTFGNYKSPEGQWGQIVTPDDLHYTYLWGVELRASNGMPYTDAQIQFHINASMREIERRLNITIHKTRIACEPDRRGLKKGIDYDAEESFYTYRRERIQRQGFISTRKRPVLKVQTLDLLSRQEKITDLLAASTVDKTKGLIRFFNRPYQVGDTGRAIQAAVFPYGTESGVNHLFYNIDYTAGFETSDDVPEDLRAVIAKHCAVELLNIIGDGLISGFSSSSLSMDGVSESFSSTQSATSAYYGARIKVYEDQIDSYIKDNKMKFGHMIMGAL